MPDDHETKQVEREGCLECGGTVRVLDDLVVCLDCRASVQIGEYRRFFSATAGYEGGDEPD